MSCARLGGMAAVLGGALVATAVIGARLGNDPDQCDCILSRTTSGKLPTVSAFSYSPPPSSLSVSYRESAAGLPGRPDRCSGGLGSIAVAVANPLEHSGLAEPLARMRRVKFREVIRMIEDDGWRLVAQRGSHRQYEHPTKPGKVTVAGKPNADVPKGTAANILRQAGLQRPKR